MDNSNEWVVVHKPKTLYGINNPTKNIAKDNYEDCEDQIGYNT